MSKQIVKLLEIEVASKDFSSFCILAAHHFLYL